MANRRSGSVTQSRGALVIPLVVALLIAVALVGSYRSGTLNTFICNGACATTYVDPPAELGLTATVAGVEPDVVEAGTLSADKVAAAVGPALRQAALGSDPGFVALDLASGNVLATKGSGAVTPASTTKLLTAFAALETIDPQTRFATRVVSAGPGSIVLVGGGDPYLDLKRPKPAEYGHAADVTELAVRTVAALKRSGTTSVTLGFDASLFSGPSASPHWPASYVGENITTPVSALWVSQGENDSGIRSHQPARTAAEQFAGLLTARGVKVTGQVTAVRVGDGDAELARVESATVAQILESVVQHSDNQGAEVMLRQVALAKGMAGSFDAGVAAVKEALTAAGIDTTGLALFDGSGLSRDDRISPLTLAQLVRAAAGSDRSGSLLSDLPVAGFSGSLTHRFQGRGAAVGRGLVLAKTGTLTGVNSLAGVARDADGRAMAFAVMTDRTKAIGPFAAEAALDTVAAALAGCHCGAP